jgi:hypothetical protein
VTMWRKALIVGAMFAAHQLAAQTSDNWFWPSVEIQKKFFGDLTLAANVEARVNRNYSNLRGYFGEFEAKWDFNKYLAVSANYRMGGRQADVLTDYAKSQRVTLFLYGKIKFDKVLSITNRAGVFRQYLEIRENPRDYFRDKLTIKGDFFKKVNPLVYGEYFHRFDTEPAKIDEWRLAGGLEYDVTKRHSIKGVYMLARQINVKNPEARRVVILSYTYKMRPYKKAGREDSDD